MQRVYLGKRTDFEIPIGVARGGMGIVLAILVPPFYNSYKVDKLRCLLMFTPPSQSHDQKDAK